MRSPYVVLMETTFRWKINFWERIFSLSPAVSALRHLGSVINYVLDNREKYGTVDIVYGIPLRRRPGAVKGDPGSVDEGRGCERST